MLSDFGVSRLLVNSMTVAGTSTLRGVMRWMAPELVIPDDEVLMKHSCHTKATDVWAFGMVVYVRTVCSAMALSLTGRSGGIGGKCSILHEPERRSSATIDHEWNAT